MNSSLGNVSRWIRLLKQNGESDEFAAEALWSFYQAQLQKVAKRWLKGARSTFVDEDDVALSTFYSFL